MSENNINGYDSLTPQRKHLVDKVLKNLEEGTGLWRQGWSSAAPISATTGKRYTGINNMSLTLASMENGYKDNRWATYSQILKNKWSFKKDEKGEILAKGKGVGIEYFELRDRETKERFTYDTIKDMTPNDRRTYLEKYVYPVKKYYHVFNAELIDGMEKLPDGDKSKETISERVDRFLTDWSNNESEIIYEREESLYNPSLDKIYVPRKNLFKDDMEFYLTALHEVAHSTGHPKRMNREIAFSFGTEEYAYEELRAEISSMFLAQDFELKSSDANIKNNSAYISAWKERIKKNPNALFSAIIDAEHIAGYVLTKEQEFIKGKEVKLYAMSEEEKIGKKYFNVYVMDESENLRKVFPYDFGDKETLVKEMIEYKSKPEYENVSFKEIPYKELEKESIKKSVDMSLKTGTVTELKKPSELKEEVTEKIATQENGGKETLRNISDIEVYEKSCKVKGKEKFIKLYEGGSILDNKEKDAIMLLNRIAVFSKDKEQLLRIFRSSGQYDKSKEEGYYDALAEQSMELVSKIKEKEKKNVKVRKARSSKKVLQKTK